LVSPTNGQSFLTPVDIALSATASDSDGIITLVEFFQGTNKLGQAANAPFGLAWSNVVAGVYTLIARATDNGGAVSTSSPIGIVVINRIPPVLALTQPVMHGSDFVFSFAAESNWSYRVEYADSLSPANWQLLTNVPGNGAIASITNSISTSGQRFYRVVAQ